MQTRPSGVLKLKISAIAFILFLASSVTFGQELEVRFATGEWEPYTGERLPGGGPATLLVGAICKAAGIKPVIDFVPWRRAEWMVETGNSFAAFPYLITDDRKKTYDFSEALFGGKTGFLYYSKNPKTPGDIDFERIEDLNGYTIGIMAGNFTVPIFKKSGLTVETTTNLEQVLRMLKAGRVDFVVESFPVADGAVQRLFPTERDNFRFLSKPYLLKAYEDKNANVALNALLVSRTYPDAATILKRFNAGLAAIKKSGEYDEILRRHNLQR
jgi:polar amino acid transport system substrate-binding protein